MKKQEAAKRTVTALLGIARAQFTQLGYHGASLEAIAAAGGVTRGAVYHHFGSKEGLFLAVLEVVQADVATRIERAAGQSEQPWEQLVLGCLGFVRAANRADCRRILLVDAPAVVGWEAWRRADQAYSQSVLEEHITQLEQTGHLVQDTNAGLMAAALSGALNEMALQYPAGGGRETDRAIEVAIRHLTMGFKRV